MPGTETNSIGDYSAAEIAAMGAEDFKAAQARGFTKPHAVTEQDVAAAYTAARSDLPEHVTGRPPVAGVSLGTSAPRETPQPSANVWANRAEASEEFTCPSGQQCRLRPVAPEDLLRKGILDRVTRLEGLAAALVDKAEGTPPAKPQMPSTEDFELLLDTMNLLIPLAVAEPKVYGDAEDAPDGAVRVSMIDLTDRMAIMERALSSVRGLDAFRNPR